MVAFEPIHLSNVAFPFSFIPSSVESIILRNIMSIHSPQLSATARDEPSR